jgi:hypothetical protein
MSHPFVCIHYSVCTQITFLVLSAQCLLAHCLFLVTPSHHTEFSTPYKFFALKILSSVDTSRTSAREAEGSKECRKKEENKEKGM